MADKGYDSNKNRKILKQQKITPVIPINKRNSKKKPKKPKYYVLLKKFRYLVEQDNSLLKTEILKAYWKKIKGFERKASLLYSGILAIQVMTIDGLLNNYESLFEISKYRY